MSSNEEAVAVPLLDAVGLDDEVAQVRPGRDLEDDRLVAPVGVLAGELLVAGQPGAVLGDAGAGGHPDPLQLAGEGLAAVALLLLLLGQPLLLLLEPGRVIPLPGDALAAVELEDPAGDVVEEVAVVGDGDDGPGILLRGAVRARRRSRRRGGWSARRAGGCRAVRGGPCRGRRGASRRRRGWRPSASPGGSRMASMAISTWRSRSQPSAASIASWTLACSSSSFSISSGSSGSPSRALIASNRLSRAAGRRRRPARRCRGRPASGRASAPAGRSRSVVPGRGPGGAEEVLVDARHDPQERALARAVAAEHADLGPRVEREPDVLEDLLLGDRLGEVLDREDVLRRHGGTLERTRRSAASAPRFDDGSPPVDSKTRRRERPILGQARPPPASGAGLDRPDVVQAGVGRLREMVGPALPAVDQGRFFPELSRPGRADRQGDQDQGERQQMEARIAPGSSRLDASSGSPDMRLAGPGAAARAGGAQGASRACRIVARRIGVGRREGPGGRHRPRSPTT